MTVQSIIYRFLIKYIDKLTGGNKQASILVPLCGTSVDLKWSVFEGSVAVIPIMHDTYGFIDINIDIS